MIMNNEFVYILSFHSLTNAYVIDAFTLAELAEIAMFNRMEKLDEILDYDMPNDDCVRYFTIKGTYVIERKKLRSS